MKSLAVVSGARKSGKHVETRDVMAIAGGVRRIDAFRALS